MNPIYLDYAATTPLRAEARAAMEPFLVSNHANASSVYRMAQDARAAVDQARDVVADVLGTRASDVVFTSGGTEGNNAAIKGVALAARDRGRHIITTAIEHHAVLHPVEELTERFGFESTIVRVPSSGIVDPADVERAIRPDTVLISVMWANNEIGTIQPVRDIAEIARGRGITMHSDAVQVAGKVPIDLQEVPVDGLSISAHKFYGPKGVGVLFMRSGVTWWPLLTGGGQERNRRAGTENVAGIVGLAAALAASCDEAEREGARLRVLGNQLLNDLVARIPGVHLNGDRDRRLPNNINLSFEGVHGESLLVALDMAGIMASSGSACASGSTEPSHVLRAIGLPAPLAQGSLRLTLGRDTTRDDMERTVLTLEDIVARLRRLAPAAAS